MAQCRFCKTPLNNTFVDLGTAPPSNSFVKKENLGQAEAYFPLKVQVCSECFLVQLDEFKAATEIFSEDYVYFSSFSKSWLEHAQKYSQKMIQRFQLGKSSFVVEIASNDGYLLKNFVEHNIPCLGVEPTAGTAEAARKKGVESWVRFFGEECAQDIVKERGHADLVAANNVLAHVPDINDFVQGVSSLIGEQGLFTVEFPHLMQLVSHSQFDTIYHEHFSYLSFSTVSRIFAQHGLKVFDVEELKTHGGSLRVYAAAKNQVDGGNSLYAVQPSVQKLLQKEDEVGMNQLAYYQGFQEATDKIRDQFTNFLKKAKEENKTVAGYGAAAKGNTLINYSQIKNDMIDFVVDASPHKQGRFLPGSQIPVVNEDFIKNEKPDYVVILPWNLKEEISNQLTYIREWGGEFVIAVPELSTF